MSRNIKIAGIILIIILGYFAYDFVLGSTDEASAPISATPLEEATAEPNSVVAENATVYEIVPEESEVRFELDEDLRGVRTKVVGVTNQVAAQLSFDFDDLSTAQVGTLQINARTFVTDSDFRNRAIRKRILLSDIFEFVTFVPTSIDGLPENAGINDELTFQITGDLTILNVTKSATFDVTATPTSDTEIVGSAHTIILREDYDLVIPSVQAVANVDEEVNLIIEFTARAVE